MSGWIGVDLDGTVAFYGGNKGPGTIGHPIPKMVARVKKWLEEGKEVRIMTARVNGRFDAGKSMCVSGVGDNRMVAIGTTGESQMVPEIRDWCKKHIGRELTVTNLKDYSMIELWDDRVVQVIPNTGERADCKEET